MTTLTNTPFSTGPFRFPQIYAHILEKNGGQGLGDKDLLVIGSGYVFDPLAGYQTQFPQVEESLWLFENSGSVTVVENNLRLCTMLQNTFEEMGSILDNSITSSTELEIDGPERRIFDAWDTYYFLNSAVKDKKTYETFKERFLSCLDKREERLKNKECQLSVKAHYLSLLDPKVTELGKFDYIFFTRVLMYFNDRDQKIALNHLLSLLNEGGTLYIDLHQKEFLEESIRRINTDSQSTLALFTTQLDTGPHRAYPTRFHREMDGMDRYSEEILARTSFCRYNTWLPRTGQAHVMYDTGPILAVTKLAK